MDLLWFLLLALSPLAAYSMAVARRGRLWHTRSVPAESIRLSACIAFPALVDPSLGVLAGLSVGWWAWYGWVRQPGAALWMTIAAAVWMGLHASSGVLAAALAMILAVSVVQVGFAIVQRFELPMPLSFSAGQVHGTIGHRTGLAVYLAVMIPLGFLTDYGWLLAAVYIFGLALAPAYDGAVSATVAVIILSPKWWWIALLLGVALWGMRALMQRTPGEPWWQTFGRFSPRHMDTLKTRQVIWRTTWRRLKRWPAWLIGYGAGSFALHARTWRRVPKCVEMFREAHNDWLEAWYEYGLVGLMAVAWWFWRVSDGMALGDPLTASAASLSVAMLGNFPIRVAPIAAVALVIAVLLMRRHAGVIG